MEEATEYIYELPQQQVSIGEAPLSRRALSFAIDLLIFNLVFYTPYITVFQLTSGISDELLSFEYLMTNQELLTPILVAMTTSLFILLVYQVLTESLLGRTFGQQLMGLHVKKKKSISAYLLRNLTKSVLIFLLPFDLLGFLTAKKDRLSNIIAETKVLYESRMSLISGLI